MERALKQQIMDALRREGLDSPDVDEVVAGQLDQEARGRIVRGYVAAVHRILDHHRPADPRQGWLALPEYEHIPVAAAGDSLQGLRSRIARLEKRIKNYDYARRSPEKLKADKQELRALKRLEVKVVPYFAGAPTLTLDEAVPLLQANLESRVSVRNRRQAKKAVSTRWARTKNQ